jgi:HAD superfamily hydrolase (TIGR01509 family)
MNKLTPKAILFDMGSTLIDYPSTTWEEVSMDCMAEVRKFLIKQGHELPDDKGFYAIYQEFRDEYRTVSADTLVEWSVPQVLSKLMRKLGLETNDEIVDKLFDVYHEPVKKYIYAYEDAVAVLSRINERYDAVGLVSNTVFPERVHLEELKQFGLDPLLTFKLFSSTFGLRKPHPDIFYKAANLSGFSPAECVYIGDRYLEDVSGPNEIGMPAILRFQEGREYPEDPFGEIRQIMSLSDLEHHFDF